MHRPYKIIKVYYCDRSSISTNEICVMILFYTSLLFTSCSSNPKSQNQRKTRIKLMWVILCTVMVWWAKLTPSSNNSLRWPEESTRENIKPYIVQYSWFALWVVNIFVLFLYVDIFWWVIIVCSTNLVVHLI